MSCIFCKIAAGDIPSEMVVENEHAFAFLDIQPLTRGHVLVIPREHAERFEDATPEAVTGMMALAREVMQRQTKALGAQGQTFAINNGRAAGQEVHHVHLHLVPRREGDGYGPIHALFTDRPTMQPGELRELGVRMRG
jgi:histidine triad (HIT) family protein